MEGKTYPVLICSTKALPVSTEEIVFPKGEVSSLNLYKFM